VQIAQEAERVLDTPYARIKSVAVYGGGDWLKQQQQVVEGGCDIVAATPGRLHDFVANDVLTLSKVGYFVLDEADRMLDAVWGFAEDVETISKQVQQDRQVLFFGATWNSEVQKSAQRMCRNSSRPVRISYAQEPNAVSRDTPSTGKARENIVQEVIVVDMVNSDGIDDWERWEKIEAVKYQIMEDHVTNILQQSENHKMLVFVGMRRLADTLSSKLWQKGFQASAMHGGKSQQQRLWVLEQFRTGELRLLVCTDVLCRGIDVPDLTHVVIYEMGEIEEYIHRIGRTARGRDGKGHAMVLFDYCERNSQLAAELIQVLQESNQPVPDGLCKIAEEVANGLRRKRAPLKPSDFAYPLKPSDFCYVVAPNRSVFRRLVHILIKYIRALFTWLRRLRG